MGAGCIVHCNKQGRHLTSTIRYSTVNQGVQASSSDCISVFSVNLTFGKTLMMQFCYSPQIATFWL